jgi:hypothetical protein
MPPFFMGKRENGGSESKAAKLAGIPTPPSCSAKKMTVHLLREQQALPSGWCLECKTPSLAHRLHRLLNSEQLGRLVRFEVSWASYCQR